MVEKNIEAHKITIVDASSGYVKGDQALIALFQNEEHDAVATDDAKLTRQLRIHGIPFIVPGLIIYQLLMDDMIEKKTALWGLKQLSEFISEDESSTARLLMEKIK